MKYANCVFNPNSAIVNRAYTYSAPDDMQIEAGNYVVVEGNNEPYAIVQVISVGDQPPKSSYKGPYKPVILNISSQHSQS